MLLLIKEISRIDSADVIFAEVTEGLALSQKDKLAISCRKC